MNSSAAITTRQPPVGVLSLDSSGQPGECRRHREFLRPRFGLTDELRVVVLSRGASWGALALSPGDGDPPFTARDAEQLATVSEMVAKAIQRSGCCQNPVPEPDGCSHRRPCGAQRRPDDRVTAFLSS